MDILQQIILNAVVWVVGASCLQPLWDKQNSCIFTGMAWFTGWGIAVAVEVLLVVCGVYVSLVNILLASLCFCFVVWLNGKNWKDIGKVGEGVWGKVVVGGCSCLLLFVALALWGNYLHYSPDSLINEAVSRMFHKCGAFPDSTAKVHYVLFNVRLPFYISVNNIAYLAGINFFYSFLSASTVFITVFVVGIWLEEYGEDRNSRHLKYSVVALVTLLLSSKIIQFHTFYYLSNLTSMTYFTVGLFSLYRYLRREERYLLLYACFFLGLTGIIRKEMLVFSLIPVWYVLFVCKGNIGFLYKIYAFIAYSFCSYTWYFWGMSLANTGFVELLNSGIKTSSHGGILVSCMSFVLAGIVFLLPWQKIKCKRGFVYILYVLVIALTIVFKLDDFSTAFSNLVLLMFTENGMWGFVWYLLLMASIFWGILRVLDLSCDDQTHSRMSFLPFVLGTFLIVRVVLYVYFDGPQDVSWNDSGNRILLHILPVAVYFIIQQIFSFVPYLLSRFQMVARN